MQIDDQHLETGVLPAFISRHDYKDNHDVVVVSSSSCFAQKPRKAAAEGMVTSRQFELPRALCPTSAHDVITDGRKTI